MRSGVQADETEEEEDYDDEMASVAATVVNGEHWPSDSESEDVTSLTTQAAAEEEVSAAHRSGWDG